MNIDIIDGIYSKQISPFRYGDKSGYMFTIPQSNYIESFSLIITPQSYDLLYDDVKNQLMSCVVCLDYGMQSSLNCNLFDCLVLSSINHRKIKYNDMGQLIIPLDFWIEGNDQTSNYILRQQLNILLIIHELPLKVQIRVKYRQVVRDTQLKLFEDSIFIVYPRLRLGAWGNISIRSEWIVIYGKEDINVSSIQYVHHNDVYNKNGRIIVSNNIIQKRIFSLLYNIIPINHQYLDMKGIRNDYYMYMDVEYRIIEIMNVNSTSIEPSQEMIIFSVGNFPNHLLLI